MVSPRPPLLSVEQVREELRRLGYLETGLDRFVLSGAGAASPLRACVAAAARVGLLGGILFGPILALAAAALDPRLLAERRDLAVLALYLVLVSGAATGLAAFLGGMAAAWAGRRLGRSPGPSASGNVGLALGLGWLIYLALWWRSHASGSPLALQVTALAAGLGLSLVLGRFGSLAAVAVLSAGGVGDRLPQARLSRRHLLPLLASAAVLLGGGAAAAYLGGVPGSEAPDFAVIPTGLRVRVLGIDGLDARMVEQMAGRGEMPRLKALLASGARARLKAEPEQVPAIVWTTIATGRGPATHGIRSTGARRLAGMRTPVPLGDSGVLARMLGRATDLLRLTRAQPATSVLRGAKALWNVASEKGLRVGVVNWWATWPADPVNGYLVSDRAFFKLEKAGAFDREAHPPAVFERLQRLLPGPEGERARRLDLFHLEAALLLRSEKPPDLEALYLPGLDIFTMQQLGEAPAEDPAALGSRLDGIRSYYRFVDDLIGRLHDDLRGEDVLVMVGDPGRLARRANASPEGILLFWGRAVAPGDLGLVSARDVAPTVLHLAGLPASRELEGSVLEAALSAAFRTSHPVRTVGSYGRRPPTVPAESAFDREMLEELRSLGYVQ